MTIEALWVAYVGDVYTPEFKPGASAAGVVVLDTGRVYGGDGSYYWIGRYTLDGKNIRATIRSVHYNGPAQNVFGTNDANYEVVLIGTRLKDDIITGNAVINTGITVPVILVRKQLLP